MVGRQQDGRFVFELTPAPLWRGSLLPLQCAALAKSWIRLKILGPLRSPAASELATGRMTHAEKMFFIAACCNSMMVFASQISPR